MKKSSFIFIELNPHNNNYQITTLEKEERYDIPLLYCIYEGVLQSMIIHFTDYYTDIIVTQVIIYIYNIVYIYIHKFFFFLFLLFLLV